MPPDEFDIIDERMARELAFRDWLNAGRTFALWILIAVCVVVWGIAEVAGGTTRLSVLLQFGAQYTPLIQRGEWWRLLSAGVLHIGPVHLLMNMWCAYALGPFLERYYGPWKLLGLFTFSVLGGSLGSLVAYPDTIAAGASGGIFGWLGVIGVLYFKYRRKFTPMWSKRLASWLGQVVIANVILGLAVPSIAQAAHLGGMLFGALFALLVPSRAGFMDRPRWWTAPIAALTLLYVPALALAVQNAWQMRSDPWAYPKAHYVDSNFELDYPMALRVGRDQENTTFEGPGLRVDVGVLSEGEQLAMRDAIESKRAKFADGEIEFAKVERLEIGGQKWTRYVSTKFPIEFYVHDRKQWHVFTRGVPEEIRAFSPQLRQMVESFRFR